MLKISLRYKLKASRVFSETFTGHNCFLFNFSPYEVLKNVLVFNVWLPHDEKGKNKEGKALVL